MAGEITMGKLVYRIIGDNVELKKAINDSEQVINRFGKGVNEIAAGLRTAGKVMTGIGTVMVGALSAVVVKTAEAAGEIDDLAKRTGIARERLQELGYAAKQNGSSIEGLAIGLNQLSRNMLDAANDTGEAKDVLKALDISLVDSQGNLRNSADVLLDVADRFSRITSETEMTAVAMRLFGRSGAELVPFLREGRDGIERLSQEARDLGFVLGEESVKDLEAFGDEIDAVKAGFAGMGRQIAVDVLPLAQQLLAWLKEAVKWFNSLPESTRKTASTLAAFGGALSLVTGPMLLIIGYIPQIVAGFGMIAGALTPVMIAGTVVAALTAIVTLLVKAKENARLAKLEIASISELAEAERARQYWASEVERLEKAKATGGIRPQKMSAAMYGFIAGSMGSPEYGVGAPPQALEGVIGIDQAELDNAKKRLAEATAKVRELKKAQDDAASSGDDLNVTVTGVGETARTVADVLKDMDKALAAAEQKEKLLGDRFDLNAEKAKIFSAAIDELITLGVKATDQRLQDIFRRWMGVEPDENARKVAEALNTLRLALDAADKSAEAFGSEYNVQQAKADAYKKAIEELIAAGLDPQHKKVQELITAYIALRKEMEWAGKGVGLSPEEYRAKMLAAPTGYTNVREVITPEEKAAEFAKVVDMNASAVEDRYRKYRGKMLREEGEYTNEMDVELAIRLGRFEQTEAEKADEHRKYREKMLREEGEYTNETIRTAEEEAAERARIQEQMLATAADRHRKYLDKMLRQERDYTNESVVVSDEERARLLAEVEEKNAAAGADRHRKYLDKMLRQEGEYTNEMDPLLAVQIGKYERTDAEIADGHRKYLNKMLREDQQYTNKRVTLSDDEKAQRVADLLEEHNYLTQLEGWNTQKQIDSLETILAAEGATVEQRRAIILELARLKKQLADETLEKERQAVTEQYGLERNLTEWQKQEVIKRLQTEVAALDMSVEANRVRAEAIKGILADLSATMPTLEQMTASWGQTLIDGLARAIAYGENLGDVFKSLLRQIAEWFLKYKVLMPLLGPLFGAGMTPAYAASIGVGAGWGPVTTLPFMHLSGLVEPIRAHAGYLAPDEVPAILQTGERVLSREQNKEFERLLSEPRQVQVEMHIHAVDAESFASLTQRHPEAITSVVIQEIQRNGAIRRVLMGR